MCERHIDWWPPALGRDRACNPGTCLWLESNPRPFSLRASALTTEPGPPGTNRGNSVGEIDLQMIKEKPRERKLLPPRAVRRCGSESRSWGHPQELGPWWGAACGELGPPRRGVMENGAMSGTEPLPETGQHQMGQAWGNAVAPSPLLPLSLPPAPTFQPHLEASWQGPWEVCFPALL